MGDEEVSESVRLGWGRCVEGVIQVTRLRLWSSHTHTQYQNMARSLVG